MGRRARLRQSGMSTVEFLAVLAGLLTVWQGIDLVIQLLGEHHRELSWSVGLPF